MYDSHGNLSHYLNYEDFSRQVQTQIAALKDNEESLALISLDFDNFNYINDLFSYEVGDIVLERITEHFADQLVDHEIFCRIHADHFIFCTNSSDSASILKRFLMIADIKDNLSDVLPPHYSFVASGGILIVSDSSEPLSSLLDKTNFARKKAKGNSSNTFYFYDTKMVEELQWKKVVTLLMKSALQNREFEMYLQPKVLIKTGQTVGAEALVRWKNAEHGTIYPDQFIPIMEQNGFILQLDFFMLREACAFLKNNIKNGITPLPISVNFSKAHINTDNFVEKLFYTVNQAKISTNLIEIEFTESIFADAFEKLIETVANLKFLGFRVSLDDFGSAYSSLNCLKDLPIDVIKIDKAFLNATTNTDKGRGIISKMVELIKSLRMITVMEGIEDQEQVDFLQKLSCDIGQGYFYAKPMPKHEYLEYIRTHSIVTDVEAFLSTTKRDENDTFHNIIPEEFQMDNWELYTLGRNIDMGLMKGYVTEEATVQYVNDRALEYLGYSRQEFREIFHNSIAAFTHPDDVAAVQSNMEQLMKTGKPLRFQTRAIRKDGKVIVFKGNSSCVLDSNGRPIGIYAFQDVTEELEMTEQLQNSLQNKILDLERIIQSEYIAQEKLRISEEKYRLIVEQSDNITFEWDFDTDNITFSQKFEEFLGRKPITEQLCTNPSIRKMIHPDDQNTFEKWIEDTYRKPNPTRLLCRIQDYQGNYIWLRCRSTALCDSGGVPLKAIGIFANVNEQKKELETLSFGSQMAPLTNLCSEDELSEKIRQLLAAHTGQPAAFFLICIDDFDSLLRKAGQLTSDKIRSDTAYRIQNIFRKLDIIGKMEDHKFAVYMWGFDHSPAIEAKANLLVRALRNTYYEPEDEYVITVSVGVSCFPNDGSTYESLHQAAQNALAMAQRSGAASCRISGT